MVFIGYNHKGIPVSIVSARGIELAKAFWQGASIDVHSHKCVENSMDFIQLDEHPTGVYAILKTEEVSKYSLRDDAKIIMVKTV